MKVRSAVLAVLLALSLALPAAAQQLTSDWTVGKLIEAVRAKGPIREGGRRVQPNIVAVDWADYAFIIPAAGNVQGSGGTHFRSDVTLINYSDTPQRITVAWMPAGQNNCAAAVQSLTIGPGWRFYSDFVGQQLGRTGLGTLLFVAANDSGTLIDEDGEIDGFSRIWTNQPNATGTVSQPFGSYSTDDLFSTLQAYIIGLRHDSGFRTNVGIVNLDSVEHTWDLEIHGAVTAGPGRFTMTVPGCALAQGGVPSGNWGPALVALKARSPGPQYWSAYASSTDNTTGDGWIVHANHGL
ncbi:MAG TPA: hypothetical protein VF111_06935 [Thermoanaerobaculia bacterium]